MRRNASHPPLIDIMRRLPPQAECNRCPNGPKSRGFCRIFFHPSQQVLPYILQCILPCAVRSAHFLRICCARVRAQQRPRGSEGGTLHFFRILYFYAQSSVRPHKTLPKTPRKTSWGPENTKNSDQKIKIPKKKKGSRVYLAYCYFLAHKRDMAMATAHASYFRK